MNKETKNHYTVDSFVKAKLNPPHSGWIDGVTYRINEEKYTRTRDAFLAKFERVQS
jgi:hypothetical protein